MSNKKTFFQSIFTKRDIISSVNVDKPVDENIEQKMIELLRSVNNEDAISKDEEVYFKMPESTNNNALNINNETTLIDSIDEDDENGFNIESLTKKENSYENLSNTSEVENSNDVLSEADKLIKELEENSSLAKKNDSNENNVDIPMV